MTWSASGGSIAVPLGPAPVQPAGYKVQAEVLTGASSRPVGRTRAAPRGLGRSGVLFESLASLAEVAHLIEVKTQAVQAGDDFFEGGRIRDVTPDDRRRGAFSNVEAGKDGTEDRAGLTADDQLVAPGGHPTVLDIPARIEYSSQEGDAGSPSPG